MEIADEGLKSKNSARDSRVISGKKGRDAFLLINSVSEETPVRGDDMMQRRTNKMIAARWYARYVPIRVLSSGTFRKAILLKSTGLATIPRLWIGLDLKEVEGGWLHPHRKGNASGYYILTPSQSLGTNAHAPSSSGRRHATGQQSPDTRILDKMQAAGTNLPFFWPSVARRAFGISEGFRVSVVVLHVA